MLHSYRTPVASKAMLSVKYVNMLNKMCKLAMPLQCMTSELCIAATSTKFVMTQPASIRRVYATFQQRPIPKLRLLLTQNSKTDYALEL